MSQPIVSVRVTTPEEKSATVKALFDSGSFYSILREDRVPPDATVLKLLRPRKLRAAAQGSSLTATGELPVVLTIGGREVDDVVLVSPDLSQELLVGAGTMQKWDIRIVTRGDRTEVSLGRDMHDPEVTEVA